MPVDSLRTPGEVTAPKGAHLAVLNKLGQFMAIPHRAVMAIVTDPSRADGIYPLVLEKVTLKKLVFRCACGDPSCTRVVEFHSSQKGLHRRKS